MTPYAALAEPNRREILDLLRGGERSVNDLVGRLTLSQPGVSKHLKVLREAGLVDVRSQGKQRLYALRSEPLAEVDAVARALPRVLVEPAGRPRTTTWRKPMIDGTLETIDGRPALRFERRLAHSLERVWRAVTEPAELAQWFVAPVAVDAGARRDVRGRGAVGRDHRARGAARCCAGPGREERYAFELAPDGDGCRLVFIHVFDRATARPRSTPPAGRPTSIASTRISTAAPCPRRTRTARSASCTSATRPASARTRRPGGA